MGRGGARGIVFGHYGRWRPKVVETIDPAIRAPHICAQHLSVAGGGWEVVVGMLMVLVSIAFVRGLSVSQKLRLLMVAVGTLAPRLRGVAQQTNVMMHLANVSSTVVKLVK